MFQRPLVVVMLTAFCAIFATGCTHTQLRYNHTRQAQTVTGIYERQVLDNLAMFASNPNAVPFFSVPEGGSAQVTDGGSVSTGPLNGPTRTLLSLPSLSRNNSGSWTFKPISDPDRLQLMRCAYRHVLGIGPGDGCQDCCKLTQEFAGQKPETGACNELCCIGKIKYKLVKSDLCLRPCQKVGSYCGYTIEICRESHDDFGRLVLQILEYAVKDPEAIEADPEADIERYHYLKTSDGDLIFDESGRPIIDYVDKFKAKANKSKPSDPNEGSITPIVGSQSSEGSPADKTINELRREQRRSALFPAF